MAGTIASCNCDANDPIMSRPADSPFGQANLGGTSQQGAASPRPAIHRYASRRPAELEAPPVDQAEYHAYRTATDLREPYRVPLTYLRETKKFVVPELPEAPLIVFINSRSGGRAGPKLAETLFHALGHSQVYDLSEYRPGPVLEKISSNLTSAIRQGDKQADIVRRRLRILAAGGDGTVAWILKTVRELQLDPAPAVAIMPLGTGNDLSLSFGWGNTFLHTWIADYKTLYATMKRIADAETRELDTWNLTFSAGSRSLFKQLPHSLALVDDLQKSSSGPAKVEGLFYNYFSVGLDAQAAYGFHHLRETKPWAAPSRLINQAWYAYFSCSSGWFCGAPSLNTTATLKVKGLDGKWQPVRIPKSVKALVLLNLQSYGGGRDIWGLADDANDTKRGWKTPIFNDGMFEAVGLRSGYHTAIVMGGLNYKVHGLRLAQANEMQLELKAHGQGPRGVAAATHMQLDGEPWVQELPHGEDATPMQLHITPSGTSSMLFNTEKLSGLPRKIKELARREAEVSMVQQMSTNPGDLPDPAMFEHLRRANSTGQPRTPITVALPATRQLDKPARAHRTPKLGNPAVPVASAVPSRQHSAPQPDALHQTLSLGVAPNSTPDPPGSTQSHTAQVDSSRLGQSQAGNLPQTRTEQSGAQQLLSGQGNLQQPFAGQGYDSLDAASQSATALFLPEQHTVTSGGAQQGPLTSGGDAAALGRRLQDPALAGSDQSNSLLPGVSEPSGPGVSSQHGHDAASSQHEQDESRRPGSLAEPGQWQVYQQGQSQHYSRQDSLPASAPVQQQADKGQTTSGVPANVVAAAQPGAGPGQARDSSQVGLVTDAVVQARSEPRQDSPVRARIQALEAKQSQRSLQHSGAQRASALDPSGQLQPTQGSRAYGHSQGQDHGQVAQANNPVPDVQLPARRLTSERPSAAW